jgi:hypothetical protein
LKRLEEERNGVQEPSKTAQYTLENLEQGWLKGDLQYRVDLQFALAPDGLRWSTDNGFLNKTNPQLFQAYKELLGDLKVNGGR